MAVPPVLLSRLTEDKIKELQRATEVCSSSLCPSREQFSSLWSLDVQIASDFKYTRTDFEKSQRFKSYFDFSCDFQDQKSCRPECSEFFEVSSEFCTEKCSEFPLNCLRISHALLCGKWRPLTRKKSTAKPD